MNIENAAAAAAAASNVVPLQMRDQQQQHHQQHQSMTSQTLPAATSNLPRRRIFAVSAITVPDR